MLSNLTTQKNIRTFSVSPENLTGEKGKGGMSVNGTGSSNARDLGPGWKNNPYLSVSPGTTCVLADIKGQGCIKHIWLTGVFDVPRAVILRIYFDGCEKPAIEAPVNDFFANTDALDYRQLDSIAMSVNPARGMNCYFGR